ncbi:MAG: RNA polymerase sigma factor [Bacteroidota bacterium]
MKIVSFYKNEKQLIKKAVQGHRDAQERLYTTYAPKMLGVCRRYIRDLQFAEDVMVNGFVKVFQGLGSFRHQGSFEGWIRRIMVRESISYLRQQQFVVYDDTLYQKNEQTNFSDTSANLDVEYIQKLIDALPEGYRIVFVLYAVEGYKHWEIADILGISESTSKSQLHKARKVLQQKLKEQNIIGYGTQ